MGSRIASRGRVSTIRGGRRMSSGKQSSPSPCSPRLSGDAPDGCRTDGRGSRGRSDSVSKARCTNRQRAEGRAGRTRPSPIRSGYARTARAGSAEGAHVGGRHREHAELRAGPGLRRPSGEDRYVHLAARRRQRGHSTGQRETLAKWLDDKRGRQIHFHWVGGTVDPDGLKAVHSAEFDRIYTDALDIDYASSRRARIVRLPRCDRAKYG